MKQFIVHSINIANYTKDEVNAWANGNVDVKKWDNNFLNSYTLVAKVIIHSSFTAKAFFEKEDINLLKNK